MKIYVMGKLQKGSNQYVKRHNTDDVKAITALILGTTLVLTAFIPWSINKNSPVFDQFTFGVNTPLVLAAEPKLAGVSGEMKEPTVENVVSEIARVFAPYGKQVVKQALEISACESGWRAEAVGHNTNQTSDFNIFQINSIHLKRFGSLFTSSWVENIRVAEVLYRESKWGPWVCAKKLGFVR